MTSSFDRDEYREHLKARAMSKRITINTQRHIRLQEVAKFNARFGNVRGAVLPSATMRNRSVS